VFGQPLRTASQALSVTAIVLLVMGSFATTGGGLLFARRRKRQLEERGFLLQERSNQVTEYGSEVWTGEEGGYQQDAGGL
jgi:hypothetical protein